MAWLVPYTELDDQQKDFIDNVDIDRKNVWIRGFPGSGKSVLLAHVFNRIMRKDPQPSILVVVFTLSLKEMFEAAFQEMRHHADIQTYFQFKKSTRTYDYILCDEVQDIPPTMLQEMNRRAKHVIVAGDENQSIYDCDPQTHETTVSPDQIKPLLNAIDFSLKTIHRLSRSLIRAVGKFLPRLDIFSGKKNMLGVDVEIRLCEANDAVEEAKYILQEGRKAIRIRETVVVLIPTHKAILNFINNVLSVEGKPEWQIQLNQFGKTDFNQLNCYLKAHDIPMQYVGNGYGSFSSDSDKIAVMTYHSSKGLDFVHVFIPGMKSGAFIAYDKSLAKTLFMVAMTRSRKNLYITYSGYRHEYIENFANDCKKIDIHDLLLGQTAFNNTNIFGGI